MDCKQCNDKGFFRINAHEFTCPDCEYERKYNAAIQHGKATIRAIVGEEDWANAKFVMFAPAWFMDDSEDKPE